MNQIVSSTPSHPSPPINDRLRDHVVAEGWGRVAGVVPGSFVRVLEAQCRQLSEESSVAVEAVKIVSDPVIAPLLFNDAVLDAVTDILGHGAVLMPSVTVRKNVYVDWHLDAAFLDGLAGVESRTTFLQCAIYLTANRAHGGGGLSVVPRSHHRVEVNGRQLVDASRLSVLHHSLPIECEPGDLVVWDGRLLHASSKPLPEMGDRYGLFVSFARADAPWPAFLTHLSRRGRERRLDGDLRENHRFTSALELAYPRDFESTTVERFERRGMRLAATASR